MILEKEYLQLDKQLDSRISQFERENNKIFAESRAEIRALVHELYEEYEEGGAISQAEINKYNRREKLDEKITTIIVGLYFANRVLTNRVLRDVATEQSIGVKSILESVSGKRVRGMLDSEQINGIIQKRVNGITLSDRIHRNRNESIYQIKSALQSGIDSGYGIRKMSQNLNARLDIGQDNAERIMRTESHRVMGEVHQDQAQHAESQGIKLRKYWLTAGDARVRDSHQHMGAIYSESNAIPIDEDFVNPQTGGRGLFPGEMGVAADDINCRCIAPYIVID